jgi:hypothetical protein
MSLSWAEDYWTHTQVLSSVCLRCIMRLFIQLPCDVTILGRGLLDAHAGLARYLSPRRLTARVVCVALTMEGHCWACDQVGGVTLVVLNTAHEAAAQDGDTGAALGRAEVRGLGPVSCMLLSVAPPVWNRYQLRTGCVACCVPQSARTQRAPSAGVPADEHAEAVNEPRRVSERRAARARGRGDGRATGHADTQGEPSQGRRAWGPCVPRCMPMCALRGLMHVRCT